MTCIRAHAIVEHMAMENEELRGLLRECCAYLEPVHDQFMRAEKHEESSYVAGANLHAAIEAALSQQAEPAGAQDERGDALETIHQYAFEVGGTEDGSYVLEKEELDEVVRLAAALARRPCCPQGV